MPKLSNVYVPDEGPDDANILFVGEAPGKMEQRLGRPFVSRSVAAEEGTSLDWRTAGDFLERYIGRCGLHRSDVYLANLGHYRPSGNRFTHYFQNEDKLQEGLNELGETINRVDPNIIVTLGAWPMYFLTGATGSKGKKGTGISNWRGSELPAIDDHVPGIAGRKVFITWHPSYVMRPATFGYHPIWHADLQRAVVSSESPELSYPEYTSLIDPPNVWDIADQMREAEWLSVDIETFGEQLACAGFTDRRDRGLCLTYENPLSWDVAQELLRCPANKIFQFGTFDINWLHHFMGWSTVNYSFDTYIAAANLMPEFPRGLDFLTSIYTHFPFYKEERKKWKEDGNLKTLWEYNIKDIIATLIIAEKQMAELEDLYPPEQWAEQGGETARALAE